MNSSRHFNLSLLSLHLLAISLPLYKYVYFAVQYFFHVMVVSYSETWVVYYNVFCRNTTESFFHIHIFLGYYTYISRFLGICLFYADDAYSYVMCIECIYCEWKEQWNRSEKLIVNKIQDLFLKYSANTIFYKYMDLNFLIFL